MWKNIDIQEVGSIEKCVGEFQILMQKILPFGKMKIKVYGSSNGIFTGYTDIRIIRKYDDSPEGAVGYGKTVDKALEDTINYFIKMVEEDYSNNEYFQGLSEDNIVYSEYCNF